MKQLILGSTSPRRKDLLETLGFEFSIRTKETDESFPAGLTPNQIAEYVAKKKALALITDLHSDEVLLCADTIVVLENDILGKPIDRTDALDMLSRLSGKTHEVITGVICHTVDRQEQFSVSTKVHFNQLTSHEIAYYVDNFKPFDKAGSYGIQDWIGCVAIERIEGSYTNVVGLPTKEVYECLLSFQLKRPENFPTF
jgi:septum formation protein